MPASDRRKIQPKVEAVDVLAVKPLSHIEYLHDHVRIENMLFDGTL